MAGESDYFSLTCKTDRLEVWLNLFRHYGYSWKETAGVYFYHQEYWQLMIHTYRHAINNDPLAIGSSHRCMKTGSKKTRELRVNKLVDAGWFTKQMSTRDHRVFYLLPTEYMQELMNEHINAMYHQFIKTTCTLLDQSPVGITNHPNPKNILMFIDFLINYTDDWHHTFNGRLPTAPVYIPSVS